MLNFFINNTKPPSASQYTLDFNLSSSLSRVFLYSLRKFPSLQDLPFFPKSIGKWPEYVPRKNKDFTIDRVPDDRTRLTYLGHRTVYIQMEGATLMTDPVLTKRIASGGFGVKRVSKMQYRYWEFPPADILLISNNSYDCLDARTLRRIGDQGGALAVGGMKLGRYLNLLFDKFTYPLTWFEELDLGSVKITFLPAMSETKRKYMCCGIDRNRMLWGGFLVRSKNSSIFYAGKTNYSKHFEEIKDYLEKIECKLDVAILPIGPIFKEKRNMTPEDAVATHLLLKPKKTMIVAHDTFPLGIEAYGELKKRLLAEIKRINPYMRNDFLIPDETEYYDFVD